MDRDQLKKYIVKPTLKALSEYNAAMRSPAATEILLNIVAHESTGGKYIAQVGGGPALSVFQIEPKTHKDVWRNFVSTRVDLKRVLWRMTSRESMPTFSVTPDPKELIFNLKYACAIARVILWRAKGPLPAVDDLKGQAEYWKKNYNSEEGAGTVEKFIADATAYI